MSPHVRQVVDEIERVGGVVDEFWPGGKHLRLAWRIGARKYTETISHRPPGE